MDYNLFVAQWEHTKKVVTRMNSDKVSLLRMSSRKEKEIKIKQKNNEIIRDLYHEGKCKYNPFHKEDEYYEGHVIKVPKSCFVAGRAYKVGA